MQPECICAERIRRYARPEVPVGGILRQPAHRGRHRTHVGLQLRRRQCSGKGHALFLQQRELPRPPSLNSDMRDKITSEGALCRFKSPLVVRCFSVKVNRYVNVIAKLMCERIEDNKQK